MIVHDSDPNRYLIEVEDLSGDAEVVVRYRQALKANLEWAESFLMQPHQDLGREGAVCPFVGPAIEKNLFWMTVYEGEAKDAAYDSAVAGYRDWFQELEPRSVAEASYKVLFILFPTLPGADAPDALEAAVTRSKEDMDARQMASLACYPTCDATGLRRADFRPFQAPSPFIAMRNMVGCDIFAMRNRTDFEIYLRIFGADLPANYRPMAEELAQRWGVDLDAALEAARETRT